MADLSSNSDSEQEHRRRLLSAARNGQATAKAELRNEYHVRVYSEAERSALRYDASPPLKCRASQRRLTEWTQIDDAAMSDDVDLASD